MVKFISYTGKYPNLCSGILTVEIDGKEYRFGHDYTLHNSWETDGNYEKFWVTGGKCWFDGDWNEYIDMEAWQFEDFNFPEELIPYKEELLRVFKENVEYGCCGGCI